MKQKFLLLFAILATAVNASDFDFSAKNNDGKNIYYNILSEEDLTCEVTRQLRYEEDRHYSEFYSGDIVIPSTVTYGEKTYSVTSIGSYAFCDNCAIKSVTIPESVTSIGEFAFWGCNALTSVEIPDSVTSIGRYAFYSCSSLTSVEIPNSVTSIGESAFCYCRRLESFLGKYASDDHRCLIVDGVLNSFACGASLTSYEIPSSVTTIGNRAFERCSSLISVTIPNSVTSIGDLAFSFCSSLASVTVENDNPANISLESAAFLYVPTSTCVLYVPAGSKELYAAADQWKEFSTIKEISNSSEENNIIYYTSSDGQVVEPNKTDAFGATILSNTYENGQGKIVFDGDVTSIGNRAFYCCYSLTSVEIPNSVISIGKEAFTLCISLTSVTIGNSVTSIENRAFDCCSSLTSVEIPNSVTSIGKEAFNVCSSLESFSGKFASEDNRCLIVDGVLIAFARVGLTSYEIPNSVTSIGNRAFNGCKGLTSVEIPESVTSIGNYAFDDCENLTSVEIPNSVTSIGEGAFYGCSKLTSVEIPNSVTSIGEGAFYNCSSLESFSGKFASEDHRCLIVDGVLNSFAPSGLASYEIPNSVTSIGNSAFASCSSLTSVEIPNSVTSIGEGAFKFCSSLTSVTIPNSVTSIGYWAFYYCKSLTSVEIPNSVTSIGNFAFQDCFKLTLVKIPNSVTSIGNRAFNNCKGLTSVIVENDNPANISLEDNVFNDVPTSTCVLYVPSGSEELYAATDQWKAFTKIEEISNSSQKNNIIYYTSSDGNVVTPYETDAFGATIKSNTYENGQGKIVFDVNVTSIGNYAFNDCKGLTSVEIPESVTSIGKMAFSLCSSLSSVTIPNSVTSIGVRAFQGCTSLTSMEIPNSVTSIGEGAFYGCENLTLVEIPNSVTSIGEYAFSDCKGLTSVEIPNSVTSIGNGAFRRCYNLKSFSGKFASDDGRCLIVDGVLNSFARVGMTSYKIPNSVTSIGEGAFEFCYSLTSVLIPESVTSIGEYAFYYCSSLTSVTIPNSVTTIGEGAFKSCSSLTSVEIPNSVTKIGEGAFQSCSSLNSFSGKYASDDHRCLIIDGVLNSFAPADLTSYEIPNSVTSIGNSAFYYCTSLTSVTIPNSVTSIGRDAFSYCSSLTSVEIPNSVTTIGFAAFDNCKGLTSVEIPNSVTSIGEYAFSYCSKLTSVVIPNSVTSIGNSAFNGCSSLTSVTIPNSVTSIGQYAFRICSKLTSVTVENDNPANITLGNWVFEYVPTSTCVLYVPAGSKELYAAADQWRDFQNIVERATIDAVTDETTVSTENLIEQDLTDNVVDNVYYNLNDGESGYDSTDGSIVIGSTTNMNEIADKEPGSADVAQNFNGLILKVAKGQGTITVNVKTTGNAQLVVQVGNQTPMIATRTEKGDVMVSYDVEEDTYVYIYAIIGSSYARTRGEAAEDDAVKIYGIKITPGVVNDINGDGTLDISDVVVLVNMVLEGSTDESGDINGDGEVDISDVVTLVNMILSK